MNFLHSYNLNPDSRFNQLTLINTFLTFQSAVSATFEAIRNQSPLVPAMGNITMSDLARRRKKSKVKNDSDSDPSSTNV